MEGGVREHNVEQTLQGDLARVHAHKFEVGEPLATIVRAGEPDHFLGPIETYHPSTRQSGGNFGRDLAIARTDIEHRLVASELEAGDQLARPGELSRRMTRIFRWIPFVHDPVNLPARTGRSHR